MGPDGENFSFDCIQWDTLVRILPQLELDHLQHTLKNNEISSKMLFLIMINVLILILTQPSACCSLTVASRYIQHEYITIVILLSLESIEWPNKSQPSSRKTWHHEGFVSVSTESGLRSICLVRRKRGETWWTAGRLLHPAGSNKGCNTYYYCILTLKIHLSCILVSLLVVGFSLFKNQFVHQSIIPCII